MTNMQRAKKILAGLLLLLCSGLMVYDPENGLYIVALILSGSLILYGIRCLSLYIFMARYMVGGKAILYRGIIILDLGVFTLSMVDDPKLYIIFYLLGFHAFAGVLDILRALEARRYRSPSWRRSLLNGVGNMAVAIIAVFVGFFLHSTRDLVYLYAACLCYSASTQIATAFRKTAIVYIQ